MKESDFDDIDSLDILAKKIVDSSSIKKLSIEERKNICDKHNWKFMSDLFDSYYPTTEKYFESVTKIVEIEDPEECFVAAFCGLLNELIDSNRLLWMIDKDRMYNFTADLLC